MMNTKKIVVPRGTFNVRDRGNTDGFPLVMLHGWPESSYCWEAVTPFLNPAIRVIAPDLRGLGDSERTMKAELYQKAELAKDVVEILDALNIDTLFLAGHDWGGVVAQEVALLIPSRIKKMVIMNIPVITNAKGNAEAMAVTQSRGSVPNWYQYFQQQPGLAEAMIKGNEEVWIRYFFGRAGKMGKIPEKAIEEYVRCYRIENTPATGACYYRNMRYDAKRWATLAGVKFSMPTLYVYGNADVVVIPEYLNHIEDCFDSITVVQINAEHFVQEQEAEAVAASLNDFLRL
jgi:haloacetate dehalogenase